MTKSLSAVGVIFLAILFAASALIASSSASASEQDEAGAGGKEEQSPRVAVADFVDRSHARVDNLGSGFAAKLSTRLEESGVRVVRRGEIEARMQEQGLDPTSVADVSFAARELGVDLVVKGVVESLSIDAATLDIAFVTFHSAQARVEATAELIDASTDAVTMTARVAGLGREPSSLSVNLGSLFSPAPSCDVCGGGLRVERSIIAEGELASVGYFNDSTSGWFGLEVFAADGTFLRWLGWRFIERRACETWFWNLRDGLGLAVGPGVYTLRVRDGGALSSSVTLQVRPNVGLSLPSFDLITVGAPAFDAGSAGKAIDDAVNQVVAALLSNIFAHEAALEPGGVAEAPREVVLLAQVADVLPDGRATINAGASDGVAVGDRFEVLAVGSLVFDPETLAIVSYDVLEAKGQIEIVEVRDRASTGVRLGDFEPLVGDLARRAS